MCPVLHSTDRCSDVPLWPPYRFVQRHGRQPTCPVPTEPRTRRVDGLDFYVRVTDDGPPLVLLHGVPDSGEVWRHQVEPLAAIGRTVIVPDLRGCGATAAPTATSAYHLDRLARDVLDLVEALAADSGPFDLAGHDWGATLGWHHAAYHPDRVRRSAALSVGHPEAYRRAGLEQKLEGWYLFLFLAPRLAEKVLSARDFDALTH